MRYLLVFELLMLFYVCGCRDADVPRMPYNVDLRETAAVIEGDVDPIELGSRENALKCVNALIEHRSGEPMPGVAARNLAQISLEWGRYEDAYYYGMLAIEKGDALAQDIVLISIYLRGNHVTEDIKKQLPRIPSYAQDCEILLGREFDGDEESCSRLKTIMLATGGDSYLWLVAILSHKDFRATDAGLARFGEQACRFYLSYSNIDSHVIDERWEIPYQDSETSGRHDPIGRYYHYGVVAKVLELSFGARADFRNRDLWSKRARLSLTYAMEQADWRVGWASYLAMIDDKWAHQSLSQRGQADN